MKNKIQLFTRIYCWKSHGQPEALIGIFQIFQIILEKVVKKNNKTLLYANKLHTNMKIITFSNTYI